jgi:FtsP/CotA-like multicopper oxidase with cupredoxin domain
MFDFNVGHEVDVIWINLLDSTIYPDITNTCLDPNPAFNAKCSFPLKSFKTQTYLDPTNIPHQGTQHARISTSNWPTTTHVHGLEVRPTFDGNPLTWVSNNGTRGEGAMSLDESCYFANFDNEDFQNKKYMPPNLKFVNKAYNNVMKVHRYPNTQNPGNLWYHDHAMRLTLFNAASGLSGVYIIRDPKAEAFLPSGER